MKRRKKIVPMKYPVGIEYSYRKNLLWLSAQLKLSLKRRLVSKLPTITSEASNIHALPTGVIVRHDAWQDDLYSVFQQIAKDMIEPKRITTTRMTRLGPQINQYNKDEWKRLVRSQYGVNPTREEPDKYLPLLRQWATDNARLINDIPNKTINEIQERVVDALLSGQTQTDMTADIIDALGERTDVTDSRARLIARDQTAKLNGRLTQERQVDAGVDSYVWRTVGDERVRETHDAVDGMTFSWGTPPAETDDNHPGEDYQCRCWAEPILPEELDVTADLLDEDELETA